MLLYQAAVGELQPSLWTLWLQRSAKEEKWSQSKQSNFTRLGYTHQHVSKYSLWVSLSEDRGWQKIKDLQLAPWQFLFHPLCQKLGYSLMCKWQSGLYYLVWNTWKSCMGSHASTSHPLLSKWVISLQLPKMLPHILHPPAGLHLDEEHFSEQQQPPSSF